MPYGDDDGPVMSSSMFGMVHPRTSFKRGVRFSIEEIKSLSVAVIVLTFAFAIVFSRNSLIQISGSGFNTMEFMTALPISFIAVVTAFALHEMAHKIVANHFGLPASFSYSRNGLLLAAFLSFGLGFLFAAPGAVYIYGYPSRKENGLISLAGPFTNLLVAIIFGLLSIFSVMMFLFGLGISYVTIGLFQICTINVIIGAFNMIPVMPLDGAKILRWNSAIYIAMAIFLVLPAFILIFVL